MLGDWKAQIARILFRDLETGTEKELYRFNNVLTISLSPDGQWLALRRHPESLMVMSVTGGEPRELYRLEDGYRLERSITWTADGKYILFATEREGQDKYDLCRIPAEGGEPQRLGLGMIPISNLTVHPNGRHVVFNSHGSAVNKPAEVWGMENFLPKGETVNKQK